MRVLPPSANCEHVFAATTNMPPAGKGTSFTITLPFQLAPPPPGQQQPAATAAAKTAGPTAADPADSDAAALPAEPPAAGNPNAAPGSPPRPGDISVAVCVRGPALGAALARSLAAEGFRSVTVLPPPSPDEAAAAAAPSRSAAQAGAAATGGCGDWAKAAAESVRASSGGDSPSVLVVDCPLLLSLLQNRKVRSEAPSRSWHVPNHWILAENVAARGPAWRGGRRATTCPRSPASFPSGTTRSARPSGRTSPRAARRSRPVGLPWRRSRCAL